MLAILFFSTAYSQVSIGIRTGYTSAGMDIKGDVSAYLGDVPGDAETFHGWHLDFLINIPLQHGLYLQPVIRYVTKGTRFDGRTPIKDQVVPSVFMQRANKLQLNYLELPLNLVYKLPVGPGSLVAGLGPYVACGLKGHYEFNVVQNGQTVMKHEKPVDFSRSRSNSNNEVLRMYPWDAGANFTLGFEFKSGITIGANYSLGMTDVDRYAPSESKHHYWGLTLGFLFNREDY